MQAQHAVPWSITCPTIIALAVVDKDARGTIVVAQTPVGLVAPCTRHPGGGEGHGHDAKPEAHVARSARLCRRSRQARVLRSWLGLLPPKAPAVCLKPTRK